MTDVELAYIAGFFDGEGSVTIHHNSKPSPRAVNPNHTLQVSIANTDPSVISWIHENFGGGISVRPRPKENHRNVLQWFGRANIGANFLRTILPHLRMKKQQAEIAISFQESKGQYRKRVLLVEEVAAREAAREAIRALNSKSHIPD